MGRGLSTVASILWCVVFFWDYIIILVMNLNPTVFALTMLKLGPNHAPTMPHPYPVLYPNHAETLLA